ncbi:hypothetical protein V1294_006967 [Bradyrhizobium sp. AZCC 1678]|uniref:hypothetical protein n=1 Tax=Bradyrhizobium sp. AZCC 1678 TaxID=3117030 RepID=UPI002FEF4050
MTIAAIISDRTMINEQGLVQNAEEVVQAIIEYPTPLLTDEGLDEDEDLDRQEGKFSTWRGPLGGPLPCEPLPDAE